MLMASSLRGMVEWWLWGGLVLLRRDGDDRWAEVGVVAASPPVHNP